MIVLVAVVAFVIGGAVGALAAAWWLRRSPAPGAAGAVVAPAVAPPASAEPQAEEPPEEPDSDLKPVFEASRGVVTALEQRYQGARAPAGDEGIRTPRPRRRQGRSR